MPDDLETSEYDHILDILFIIIAIVLGFISANYIYNINHTKKYCHSPRSLLQSFQSSAAIYSTQQKTEPKSFKDFVVAKGAATGSKTLTIENIREQLESEKSPEITNPLVLTFNSGGSATYYLTGTEVTATFEGFNEPY